MNNGGTRPYNTIEYTGTYIIHCGCPIIIIIIILTSLSALKGFSFQKELYFVMVVLNIFIMIWCSEKWIWGSYDFPLFYEAHSQPPNLDELRYTHEHKLTFTPQVMMILHSSVESSGEYFSSIKHTFESRLLRSTAFLYIMILKHQRHCTNSYDIQTRSFLFLQVWWCV